MAEKNLTPEECLDIGGHCYKADDFVIDSYPPIYHRVCKHCGWRQEGHPQPPMAWQDDQP